MFVYNGQTVYSTRYWDQTVYSTVLSVLGSKRLYYCTQCTGIKKVVLLDTGVLKVNQKDYSTVHTIKKVILLCYGQKGYFTVLGPKS